MTNDNTNRTSERVRITSKNMARKPLTEAPSTDEDSDSTSPRASGSTTRPRQTPCTKKNSKHTPAGRTCVEPEKTKRQYGPTATKHKCFACNSQKWCIDFKEVAKSELGVKSVCRFCLSERQIEKQKEEIENRKWNYKPSSEFSRRARK